MRAGKEHADDQGSAEPYPGLSEEAKRADLAGFCLAAGAGSRLAPLTGTVPKPLLAPAGRALVDLAIDALEGAGAAATVVNAHHHAGALAAHLAGRPGCQVLVEPELLGTGGGLAQARRLGLLDADLVLLTCADVVVGPADLGRLAALVRAGAPAAVGLVPAPAGTPLSFTLTGGRVRPGQGGRWAGAGVYALAGEAIDRIGPGRSSLVAALLEPLWLAGALAGLPLEGAWADAGTREGFLAASEGLLAGRWPFAPAPGQARAGERPVLVVDGALVDPRATLTGPVLVDRGAVVEAGAAVERSVLGPGARVGPGAAVQGSVLGPGAVLAPGARVRDALVAAVR